MIDELFQAAAKPEATGTGAYSWLSDRYGRKPPLYFGLVLYVVTSAGCALATSLEAVIVLRFLQGLGACVGGVIARAVVADLYEGVDAARIFSVLMLVMGLAPIVAPILGGQLVVAAGWPSIFWLLTGFGTFCLIAAYWRLPETHRPDMTQPQGIAKVLGDYRMIVCDRRFMGLVMSGSFSLGGLFAYIATSPFIFIEHFGVPADTFGYLFAANAAGFIAASQVNSRLVGRFGLENLLVASGFIQMLAGFALLAIAVTRTGGLIGVLIPLWFYVTCLGFIMPNNVALAMSTQRERAGTASAVLGSFNFGIGALGAVLIGALNLAAALPMAIPIAIAGTASVIIRRWGADVRWRRGLAA